MALKYSRQREMIKDFLMTRKDHPTADVVYMNVRQSYPNISLGTVYRNLTLLADLGEIQRLRVGDGIDHFDADTSPHYHFICKNCGAVIDLEMENIDSITFVGLCTDICVISNVLITKAFFPEVPVIVDASCCAGVTPESHKNALEAMKMCQVKIVNE